MKIYKTRWFENWAKDEDIFDKPLLDAIDEMERGLKGASLGGSLYKKRIAIEGRGKRGGKRVIIVFIEHKKAFFIYGFSKNEIENINKTQETSLKEVAKNLLSYTDKEIQYAVKEGILFEVKKHEIH